MKHNTTIIEVLIGCTLLFTLFIAIRSFMTAKEPAPEGGLANLGDLEGTLKKILEQASQVPAAGVVAAAGGSEDTQKLATEINQLKAELETRQKTIEELKAAGGAAAGASAAPAAAGGMSDEEKAKLDAQLKELQAKLSEYEIISEDIADLSFYKEQNAKLTKELEAIKGGAAPAASAAPPPPAQKVDAAPAGATAEAPAKPKEEPAIVGKSKTSEPAPVEVASAPEAPPVVAAAEAAPVAAAAPAADPAVNVVDNDLMAEFNAAVEKQQSETGAATPAAAAAPEAPQEEASGVDLGAMDVDKMMAEAAAIKSDGPEISAEQALGVGLDENKLLQEATALQGVSPEDKKLMGQFENFVKKNE